MRSRAGGLRLLALLFGLLVLLAAAPVGYVLWRAGESDPGPADAAVVLGAAVFGDVASPVLVERVRHAVALHAEGRVRLLVMTGGTAEGDTVSEAEAARDWAVAHAVPPGDILVETASRTTIENFENVRPLLAANGIGRVLVVTDPLHEARALLIAARLGIDAAPAPTPTTRYRTLGSQVPMLLREAWFLVRYVLGGT